MRPLQSLLLAAALLPLGAEALEKPGVTYPVFQFPADRIPRIDGNTDDWSMVPESYAIGTDQLHDDSGRYPQPTPKTLDVKVKVGWVKGMNRLYFLYQASDDYWDFSLPGLHNDTFEIVVDGDASGGPLIDKGHKDVWTKEGVGESASTPDERISREEAHWATHGVHAQNYHIFTPAKDKEWAMAWSAATWIKDFPYANAAYSYKFKPGEGGKLTLEFWVTVYDYAGAEGPQRAVESVLRENKIIGLSWAIIDYDDVNASTYSSFWNLSPQHTMFGNASQLCAFRLMPLEPSLRKPFEARWTHSVIDMDRRLVGFKDQSSGEIRTWHWDFGDGSSADEQNPQHRYEKPGNYVVILDISGPAGTARHSKVWDVQLR